MSGCNDENTARHAPLQRNNEAGVFCNIKELKIMHPVCIAMSYCLDAVVHFKEETIHFIKSTGYSAYSTSQPVYTQAAWQAVTIAD